MSLELTRLIFYVKEQSLLNLAFSYFQRFLFVL